MLLHELRRRAQTIAILTASAVVLVGTVVIVRKIRRRRGTFLAPGTREALEGLFVDHVEADDGPGIAAKVLEHRLGRLTDKQLIAAYAAVQVGTFAHQAHIDPLHPDPVGLAQAAAAYTKAELNAPATRQAIMTALSEMGPTLVKAALRTALQLLSQ